MSEKYNWSFSTIGGITRVNISNGEDIRHLDELDQKLWTVLSCPVNGLELDVKSLQFMDSDADGKIHVKDVVAASKWLTTVLRNPDILLKREDVLPLSEINSDDPEGEKLLASAKQILDNLGLEKDSISVADTEDSVAIFSKTALNGDGIVTEQSSDDASLKDVITKIIQTVGSKTDRSGLPGVDADLVTLFYEELEKYAQWKQISADSNDVIFPYGDNTAQAFDLFNELKPKVEDFFMRCKLSAFGEDIQAVLDVSAGKIETVSGMDLSACNDEIAKYPLARLNKDVKLPLDSRINPAWQAKMALIKSIVFDVEYPDAKEISEAEWNAALAKLDSYAKWLADKAGNMVEPLGVECVQGLLADSKKDGILALIEADKALQSESESIDNVNKLLHLYRDFYKLLCNFVSFKDFYNPKERAIFQAGRLYIDERCCELCIKVTDMGPHNATAGLSGMYIMYCNCVSKKSGAAMTVAAVLTDGDVSDLREGKHGIFYDNNGDDWDATIVKIIDNPISIRQAFWSPYRKLGKFIEEKIGKNADAKDSKVVGDLTAKADNPEGAKQPFDMSKYLGVFAMVGVAFGAIIAAFAAVVKAVSGLTWWKWLIIIAVIMLLISGPAMIKAWLKLRKRNLAPVLNANDWAVNAAVKVNTPFGATLTEVAKVPAVSVGKDPYAEKIPFWKKLIGFIIGLAAVFALLYFNNFFGWVGCDCLKYERKAKAQVEQVVESPVTPVAEAPAAAPAAVE